MIYKSIDTIPAKLFYKIIETENISLLSDENTPVEILQPIWEEIKLQDEKNNPNSKANKIVEIQAKIEVYKAKLEAINHAVYVLKIQDDDDLRDLLSTYGYSYKNKEDLYRILLQSDGINEKIDRQKLRLPKQKDAKTVPFDEMVLSCGVISGAGFIDTNTITKTQLDGLIKITEAKIKASKDNGAKR